MKIYTEIQITRSHSFFGEYQSARAATSPQDSARSVEELMEFINENTDGVEKISRAVTLEKYRELGVEDIRGRIHNEPAEVYVRIQQDEITYFGIEESEVEDDFFD